MAAAALSAVFLPSVAATKPFMASSSLALAAALPASSAAANALSAAAFAAIAVAKVFAATVAFVCDGFCFSVISLFREALESVAAFCRIARVASNAFISALALATRSSAALCAAPAAFAAAAFPVTAFSAAANCSAMGPGFSESCLIILPSAAFQTNTSPFQSLPTMSFAS